MADQRTDPLDPGEIDLYGTPEKVSPKSKALPLRLNCRWSVASKLLSALNLPDSSSLANGTLAALVDMASDRADRPCAEADLANL